MTTRRKRDRFTTFGFSDVEMKILERLCDIDGVSKSHTVRRLLREEAQRRGILSQKPQKPIAA